MQTPCGRLFSPSSGLHKVILDHHLFPARFPLQKLPLTRVINCLHLSRCFRTQIGGAHDLSNRYKSLESNVRPEHLHRQVEEEREHLPALREESISSEPSQRPFLETGVSALQMERIMIKGKSILRPKPTMFHGISIPPKPPPPASDGMFPFIPSSRTTRRACILILWLDCCMSSCAICIYDLYATALEEHQDAMVTAREQLTDMDIPKAEWPIEVLSKEDQELRRHQERRGGVEIGRSLGVTGESDKDKQMAVVIGAFVEFEKALRERKREKGKERI